MTVPNGSPDPSAWHAHQDWHPARHARPDRDADWPRPHRSARQTSLGRIDPAETRTVGGVSAWGGVRTASAGPSPAYLARRRVMLGTTRPSPRGAGGWAVRVEPRRCTGCRLCAAGQVSWCRPAACPPLARPPSAPLSSGSTRQARAPLAGPSCQFH
jgi:hypothetical protein